MTRFEETYEHRNKFFRSTNVRRRLFDLLDDHPTYCMFCKFDVASIDMMRWDPKKDPPSVP